jgi:hypothetical protein
MGRKMATRTQRYGEGKHTPPQYGGIIAHGVVKDYGRDISTDVKLPGTPAMIGAVARPSNSRRN